MKVWQVQDAKTHFSEVMELARTEGPQTITKHGTERAVLLSIEEYRTLSNLKPDFKTYLFNGPKFDDELEDDELEIERDKDTGRNIAFD